MTTGTTPKTRTPKTPAQRAQEALDVANRRVIRADKAIVALEWSLGDARRELAQAITRRDYVAQDPALPQTDTTPSTGDPA